jgi:hypothetical protein
VSVDPHRAWHAEMRASRAETGLAAELRGARGCSPAAVLDLYRRGYWARIVDAIVESYPRTVATAGPAQATRLARDYVHERTPRELSLERESVGFAAWLEARRHPTAGLARLEGAALRALIAPPRWRVPLRALPLSDPASFGSRPARFADAHVVACARADLAQFRGKLEDFRGADATEAAPTTVCFARPLGTVVSSELSPSAAALLEALDGETTLVDALGQVLTDVGSMQSVIRELLDVVGVDRMSEESPCHA